MYMRLPQYTLKYKSEGKHAIDLLKVSPRPGPAVETERTTQHGLARRHTESEAACSMYIV